MGSVGDSEGDVGGDNGGDTGGEMDGTGESGLLGDDGLKGDG